MNEAAQEPLMRQGSLAACSGDLPDLNAQSVNGSPPSKRLLKLLIL